MDFELLRAFARAGDQQALAHCVHRHLDLVFGTALRKVQDTGAAEEIAQNVFMVLARKAWQFGPEDSLPAWLHKTTLLEAKKWLRGELRRRRREETAAELGTTMKTSQEQPALRALVPLLDDALLSLRETDRTALLLRFYESQSLREVGGALGVSEDAAQKRVASALEQLVQFFQRRGFRTATAGVAIAALHHTTAATSAATATLVVNATLQAAPPALAGLGLLLGRLASLTKLQTAAWCLVVAAGPVGWELNRTHEARQDAAALRTELEAVEIREKQWTTDIERLQAEVGGLETRKAETIRVRELNAAAAQQIETLKQRIRGLLTDENYRWPEDLPFVRIPKSALSSIRVGGGPTTPAKLESKVNGFLDLSPQEREATAQVFSNYYAGIDHHLETSLYETNRALSLVLPPGAESRVFVLEPLGEKIRTALDRLCADLAAAMGEDRWAMVRPEKSEFEHYEQVRLLGYSQYAWDQRQEIAVNVFANGSSGPTVSWAASTGTGSSPRPLRFFLPGNSTTNFIRQPQLTGLPHEPPVLAERVKRYLTAEAAARLSDSETE